MGELDKNLLGMAGFPFGTCSKKLRASLDTQENPKRPSRTRCPFNTSLRSGFFQGLLQRLLGVRNSLGVFLVLRLRLGDLSFEQVQFRFTSLNFA